MIRNCWTFAVGEFHRLDGWLLVRFTRRSSAPPSRLLWWLGTVLAVVGVVLVNFGAWLRTGRWLQGKNVQKLLGHSSASMTAVYLNLRGALPQTGRR